MVNKARADRILFATTALFGAVFVGQYYVSAPWYDGIYWAVQSACIGSVADWFAVNALFRKPLGIPWHTELIPRHKNRLTSVFVDMVEYELLTEERLRTWLNREKTAEEISAYAVSSDGRKYIRKAIHEVMHWVLASKSPDTWSRLLARQVIQRFGRKDIASALRVLAIKAADADGGQTKMISFLQEELRQPEVRFGIVEIIRTEISKREEEGLTGFLLRAVNFFSDAVDADDMADALLSELDETLEAWKCPGHPGREAFLAKYRETVRDSAKNTVLMQALAGICREQLDENRVSEIVRIYVWPYTEALIGAADGPPDMNRIAVRIEDACYRVLTAHENDGRIRSLLEEVLQYGEAYLLRETKHLPGQVTRSVLDGFSAKRFSDFIEGKVAEDMAWIRINGAIVGGVAGFGIWLLLYFVYDPLLRWWQAG